MSDDFQVGDVVVCVDVTTQPEAPRGVVAPGNNRNIVLGRHYRVASMFVDDWGACVTLKGVTASTVNGGFMAWRFKKLPPASEEFTRQMRALKPQRVPA